MIRRRGRPTLIAPVEDISENRWKTIVDSNLHGTFHTTQIAGEHMREAGGGEVVNVASVAGQNGSLQMSHYAAAKADVIDLTTTLAYEWADDARVNCIAPGFVAIPA